MYNQMFKKYLLKNDFWQTKNCADPCFIKHDPTYGGIYAKLLPKGVEVKFNSETRVFTNFNDLDDFLDRLSVKNTMEDNNQQFLSVMTRKMASKYLRSELPI